MSNFGIGMLVGSMISTAIYEFSLFRRRKILKNGKKLFIKRFVEVKTDPGKHTLTYSLVEANNIGYEDSRGEWYVPEYKKIESRTFSWDFVDEHGGPESFKRQMEEKFEEVKL